MHDHLPDPSANLSVSDSLKRLTTDQSSSHVTSSFLELALWWRRAGFIVEIMAPGLGTLPNGPTGLKAIDGKLLVGLKIDQSFPRRPSSIFPLSSFGFYMLRETGIPSYCHDQGYHSRSGWKLSAIRETIPAKLDSLLSGYRLETLKKVTAQADANPRANKIASQILRYYFWTKVIYRAILALTASFIHYPAKRNQK